MYKHMGYTTKYKIRCRAVMRTWESAYSTARCPHPKNVTINKDANSVRRRNIRVWWSASYKQHGRIGKKAAESSWSTGDLAEPHGQQVQGHHFSDKKLICMCLSASLSIWPLVNIPVICKQTEFTSDYEWIHQILMEMPCWARPAHRMHLHHDTMYTWIHE